LARDVSSMAGDANRVAACASASNCPAEIMPPGNRTRARAPSAAWCNCSAPGQASRSRVLATQFTVRREGGPGERAGSDGPQPCHSVP
jgi:hypothetical protein